jgi:hypothetical protein
MPGYADTYVLTFDRSATLIVRFLERFARCREEVAEVYEVPQYSDSPTHRFHRAADLVEYLAGCPSEPHAVYWRNLGQGPAITMAFFTNDGAVILGLFCAEDEAETWLTELRKFAGPGPGCILFEQPPPVSAAEFRALCGGAV